MLVSRSAHHIQLAPDPHKGWLCWDFLRISHLCPPTFRISPEQEVVMACHRLWFSYIIWWLLSIFSMLSMHGTLRKPKIHSYTLEIYPQYPMLLSLQVQRCIPNQLNLFYSERHLKQTINSTTFQEIRILKGEDAFLARNSWLMTTPWINQRRGVIGQGIVQDIQNDGNGSSWAHKAL